MAKNVIGIDIADFSMEAVVLAGGRGGFDVDAYARFRLSPDIVEDGAILNKDKLKESLLKLFKNAHPGPLEHKKVFLSVPESKVFTKVLSLPKELKDRALMEAARHRAEELIPELSDNLVLAMKTLSVSGDSQEIFYAAAELYVVRDLISVFTELGMEVEGITTEALSSFAGLDDKFKKTITLLLDMGSRTTIASIFDSQGIRDSININIAGNNIIEALAKKLKISHLVAEEKMKQVGLTATGKGEVMLVIQGQLQPVADELKKFISYYEESNNQKIEQIVLIGGLAQMQGIDKYFGDNLSKPAYLGQPFVHTKIRDINSTKYINALGLAKLAQHKPEINFLDHLPSQEEETHQKSDLKEASDKSPVSQKEPVNKFRQILKNIYLWLGLGIVILASLAFVFRGSLVNFYNHIFNKTATIGIIEQQPVPQSFQQAVTIVESARDDVGDYVLGEIFYVQDSALISDTAADYEEVVTNLEANYDRFDLANLNSQYGQAGYYIVPQILGAEVTATEPIEERFVPGEPLTTEISYKFVRFAEAKIKDFLISALKGNSSSDLTDLVYVPLRYTADSQGYVINLEVSGKIWK